MLSLLRNRSMIKMVNLIS